MRARHQQRARRNPQGWMGLGCSLLLGLLFAGFVLVFSLVYANLTRDLPSLQALPDLLDPPDGLLLEPTTLYDRTGQHVLLTLQNPAAAGRQILTLDRTQSNYLPPTLISATLATIDPGFWSHSGYSLEGLENSSQPTLAQILVSNLLLWQEPPGLRRALRERLLAAQITARYGRQQVLTWYLNSVYYGRLAYGADAAAHVYFGKPAAALSLAEAAVLAAVSQAPALNPLDAPQVARERAWLVIDAMQQGVFISAQDARLAKQAVLKFQSARLSENNPAPAFANLALEQLTSTISRERLERGGYRVLTSLDYDLQLQAICAARLQISRTQGLPDPPEIADDPACQAARLLPTQTTGLTQEGAGNPLLGAEGGLAANVVVLDPRNGQVLALTGETTPGLDPAHLPGHPPGTLLTPFIYLTGFTRGLSPASLVWDIPAAGSDLQNGQPSYHGPVRLRVALANDYLAPAAQVLSQVGVENSWRTARQMGLAVGSLPEDETASDLLAAGEVTLLDISRAYGVLASLGLQAGSSDPGKTESNDNSASLQPVTILRVEDVSNQVWVQGGSSRLQAVISPQLAYLLTQALSDEPARWPSLGHPNPLEIGRPAAAKIGRTAGDQNAWTVGYTPYLVVGVWLGSPAASTGDRVPASAAAGLWHALIQYASRSLPAEGWTVPAGVNTVAVCDPSGMLPTSECPSIVNEIFLAGSEPTQADTLYRKFQINRETGLLATVFTPSDLIEERVYMDLPPEAFEWALQVGIPTPPEAYDIIQDDPAASPDVQLSSPEMFSHVSGRLAIHGRASGDGFALYRVQVGKGLNPQRWLQVGEESSRAIAGGELGEWDTQGLSGLYAIQLVVIYQDQHVEIDTLQVTVDNQPPEVRVLYPLPDAILSARENRISLQASAQDDLALQQVEFYMDDERLGNLEQAPFSLDWQVSVGTHTLLVKAIDLAGNASQVEVSFEVR